MKKFILKIKNIIIGHLYNLFNINNKLYTSRYAYLLQTLHPEFVIKGLKLIHIDREQKETEYKVPYLKDDVERMLKHYKRQLKIEQELDRLKPAIE